MAQSLDGTNQRKPRSGCFLGCFGFSGELSDEFSKKKTYKAPTDNDHGCRRRKKSRRLFWWINKSGCKTVPVDAAMSEKANRSREIHVLKLDKKVSSNKFAQAAGVKPSQSPAILPEVQQTRNENARSINLDNGDNLELSDLKKEGTCKKGLSCCRKKGAKNLSGNHPNSPENKSVITQSTINPTTLSPSISFPPPNGTQPVNAGQIAQIFEHKPHKKGDEVRREDPMVGLSILIVILVVMLHWGKLCAIVCTATWFYIIPLLKSTKESQVETTNKSSKNIIDLDSEEYKKKVVLEGFLERNHRSVAGFL